MACQKVCKQGRDDIIVKVNLQSPIPASFYVKRCRDRAFCVFNVFLSLVFVLFDVNLNYSYT